MPSLPVSAYGFAGTFQLRELVSLFPPAADARVAKDRLIAKFGEQAWALAYDFGALVFVGVEAQQQKDVAASFIKRLGERAAPMTESFIIEIQAGAQQDVRFDRLVTPELTMGQVELVAEVIAQSVAMDYYAQDVAELERETDRITTRLRARGSLAIKPLVKFIGLCVATRNEVISTLALFDKPDATWENEQLDRLWNGLRQALEIDDRYRALEAKLRMFQDSMVVLVDLTRQRHTITLEWAVAILILMEMLIMVWQLLEGHH